MKTYDLGTPETRLPADSVLEEADPLHLDLPDDRLVQIINDRLDTSISYYRKKRLAERQQHNLEYLRGEQVDDTAIDDYSMPYMENVLFEAQMRNKPIAMGRLPDLVAKAGNDSPESKQNAELMSDVINSDVRKRENRAVLGLAYNYRPVNFFSPIKARWNPEKGENGDYEFVNVSAGNLVMDHNSPTPDPQQMEVIAEKAELSVKQVVMMFPDNKKELLDYLNWDNPNDKRSYDEKMASKMTIWEVWFHWYEEEEDPDSLEMKWIRSDGVVWKFKDLILGKMKNPYWDWEGKKRYFTKELTEDKAAGEKDIYGKLYGDQETETYYRNYFKSPQKPYFIMTYFRSGEDPVDYTSEYEQVISFQDNINAEGRQIFDMNSRTKGKFIFNADAIEQDTVESLNIHDYNEALVVDADNVSQAFTILRGDAAPQQLYQSKQDNRSIAFEMMALNATTRGTRETGDETLGARQMMREQDFGVIDDMVEEQINPAAEWMAKWAMQFMKLFYTKPHLRRLKGKDGDVLHASITQDLIEDGIEIEVSASGVDKMKRERKAQNDAAMGMIEPLSYFEDTGETNPKERARRLMIFKMAPQMYVVDYLTDKPPVGADAFPQPMAPPPGPPGAGAPPPGPQAGPPPGAPPGPPQAGPPPGPPTGGGGSPEWNQPVQTQPSGNWFQPQWFGKQVNMA